MLELLVKFIKALFTIVCDHYIVIPVSKGKFVLH